MSLCAAHSVLRATSSPLLALSEFPGVKSDRASAGGVSENTARRAGCFGRLELSPASPRAKIFTRRSGVMGISLCGRVTNRSRFRGTLAVVTLPFSASFHSDKSTGYVSFRSASPERRRVAHLYRSVALLCSATKCLFCVRALRASLSLLLQSYLLPPRR